MIGLLLHSSPKNFVTFTKMFGFEIITLLISGFTSTRVTINAMLEFSVGTYQCIAERRGSTWINLFSSPDTSKLKKDNTKPQLVYPEAIHMLLELLKTSDDSSLPVQVLHAVKELDRILEPDNMEILWNTNWLDWFLDFIHFLTDKQSEELQKALNQVHHIVQKMVLYDISRKSSQLSKFNELVENESFQVQIIEGIIDYFEKNPILPAEQANDIVSNLSLLYRHLEELEMPLHGIQFLSFRFISFIYFIFISYHVRFA
jgi:hypothetical protein